MTRFLYPKHLTKHFLLETYLYILIYCFYILEDINNSVIRFILTAQGAFYEDSFTFDIYDSRPNRIPDNSFHMTWSAVEFELALVNVTETAGIVHIPVKRRGNMKHVSFKMHYISVLFCSSHISYSILSTGIFIFYEIIKYWYLVLSVFFAGNI